MGVAANHQRYAAVKVMGDSLADVGTFGLKFTIQGNPIYPELIAQSYGLGGGCSFFRFTGTTFATDPPSSYSVSRYSYKTHPMLTAAWGIPIGDSGFSFEGFMNWIASKGDNEFVGSPNRGTKPETNIDAQIMYDVGALMGAKGKFKVGLEYQYWKNKFGNDHEGAAGDGAFAKTPMLRAEYHF